MASIFSKIIAGDIPCHKVAENDSCFAFLDINPVAPGHTLVVPKHEVDYLFDLPDDDYRQLWDFAKRVQGALMQAVPCKRVGVAVLGMEVPHAHIHLVPLNKESDLNFFKEKPELSSDELASIAKKIADKF